MAILTFPLGQHLGKLSFEESDIILTQDDLETAILILYYMGYDAHLSLNQKEITFGMRGLQVNENGDDYRNILFNFVFLFNMLDINFPNLDYAKTFLRQNFIFLNNSIEYNKQKVTFQNGSLSMILTSGIMVSGEGFYFENKEFYIDNFNAGNRILPLISKDIIGDLVLRMKIDAASGEPLNDKFANTDFKDTPQDDLPF